MNRFYPADNVLCEPLKNNAELFEFSVNSVAAWKDLVKPLKERAAFRALDDHFSLLSFAMPTTIQEQRVKDEDRRKVLVCHDLMGNYKHDSNVGNISDNWSYYR